MGFGPGSFGSGPSSVQANAAAGLPYAGVPGKLGAEVDRVLASEPEHEAPVVTFDRGRWDRRPFTLRTFLRPHAMALSGALLLVIVETIALQAGPLLTQIGIDHGVEDGNREVLIVVDI